MEFFVCLFYVRVLYPPPRPCVPSTAPATPHTTPTPPATPHRHLLRTRARPRGATDGPETRAQVATAAGLGGQVPPEAPREQPCRPVAASGQFAPADTGRWAWARRLGLSRRLGSACRARTEGALTEPSAVSTPTLPGPPGLPIGGTAGHKAPARRGSGRGHSRRGGAGRAPAPSVGVWSRPRGHQLCRDHGAADSVCGRRGPARGELRPWGTQPWLLSLGRPRAVTSPGDQLPPAQGPGPACAGAAAQGLAQARGRGTRRAHLLVWELPCMNQLRLLSTYMAQALSSLPSIMSLATLARATPKAGSGWLS